MKNIRDEEIKVEKEFEYLYFSRSYLKLAYRGIEEILYKLENSKEKYNKRYSNPFGGMVLDFSEECNHLLIPAIYDLKHAIEIFIKTLTHFLNMQPKEEHDYKILFKELKRKISGQTVDNLENLVIDYYNNEFLKNKLGENTVMEDKKNDVFRYPDNKAKIELQFFNILPRFVGDDLKKIQKDIKKFDKLFYLIGKKILEKKYGKRPKLSDMIKISNTIKSNFKNPTKKSKN